MERQVPNSRSSREAIPRWVKLFGLAALVVLVVFVALHLAGGGMRHH
jgi:hypothetical protein